MMFVLPLFIYTAGPVSGAHLNPTITMATFFGRLTTLARCTLYIAFQIFGAAIAGWLVRASLDTRSVCQPRAKLIPCMVPLLLYLRVLLIHGDSSKSQAVTSTSLKSQSAVHSPSNLSRMSL